MFEGDYKPVSTRRWIDLNILPVCSVDEEPGKEIPVAAHARRASATVANRFSNPTIPLPDAQSERGNNVLRRLSLSNAAFIKVTTLPSH